MFPFKSKFKLIVVATVAFSVFSLLVHLFYYSSGNLFFQYAETGYLFDYSVLGTRNPRIWGRIKSLEALLPYATPRSEYPGPTDETNGYIVAKIFGGFEKIRSSICDLVAISRLLNATLVIPEIQESIRSKGAISYKFRSFAYIYNEESFRTYLVNDVKIVSSLPVNIKETSKLTKFPIITPNQKASPSFYLNEVLPKLKEGKVIKLLVYDGGCLQPLLPSSMAEYQRLRCRVAFHALEFRPEIQDLGYHIVKRLRASERPYLVFNSGLLRETLAYHGCGELFQDIHTELIQYRRKQLIKRKIVSDELNADSMARRRNGSCPLMPEEVGILLRAMGYPTDTIIYIAGAEVFGGQRVLIPMHTMFNNFVDRTSLVSKRELIDIYGPETVLPMYESPPIPKISKEKQMEMWNKAGPRPRPLPPPPARPVYAHESEGWYGWVSRADKEPELSLLDLRNQAHRLLWNALDYIVSIEADAFFPGFDNDGSSWPDFAGLVMGHRLYQKASSRTYRPDRKVLVELIDEIHDHLYKPKRNWTMDVRIHLNRSLGEEGLVRQSLRAKPLNFLTHPLPECSCRTNKISGSINVKKDSDGRLLYGGEDICPMHLLQQKLSAKLIGEDEKEEEGDQVLEDEPQEESEKDDSVARIWEQDEEMDPND